MEREGFLCWPVVGVKSAAVLQFPEPVVYASETTGSVVSRAVEAIQSWNLPSVKLAAAPSIWKDTEAHPVALLLTLLDRYGEECVFLEPGVLKATLLRDGIQVSNAVWVKILAIRVVMASPSPWRQWEVFHWVARGLAGQQPNITYLEMPELGQLMACVDMCKIVDPKREFSGEVEKFIAATLKHDGHVFAPPPLDFAQRELENPQIECENCKSLNRDDNDVKCIACGSKQLHPVPYEFAALRDRCAALWAAKANKEIAEAVEGLPEDPAGNLVYNLLLQWDYARHCRKNLLQQLHTIARP